MNKEILKKIFSDDFVKDFSVEKLTKELDEELAKPDPDLYLVEELTTAILEARGMSAEVKDAEKEIAFIKENAITKKRRFVLPKWAAAISAACVILFLANAVTIFALNKDIFSAIIQFTEGGILIDFSKQDENVITLPVSEDDPYGFISKLAEYDIYFETPHYIPEGFVLTDINTNVNKRTANNVYFIYRKGQQDIGFSFSRYWNEIGRIGIPSDHYNISEREVNGSTAVVSKEDGQYSILYEKDKTVFGMFSRNVPYDECEKIIDSIK